MPIMVLVMMMMVIIIIIVIIIAIMIEEIIVIDNRHLTTLSKRYSIFKSIQRCKKKKRPLPEGFSHE